MRSTTLCLVINTTSIVIATVFSKSLALAFVCFPRKRPTSNVRWDVEHEYLKICRTQTFRKRFHHRRFRSTLQCCVKVLEPFKLSHVQTRVVRLREMGGHAPFTIFANQTKYMSCNFLGGNF